MSASSRIRLFSEEQDKEASVCRSHFQSQRLGRLKSLIRSMKQPETPSSVMLQQELYAESHQAPFLGAQRSCVPLPTSFLSRIFPGPLPCTRFQGHTANKQNGQSLSGHVMMLSCSLCFSVLRYKKEIIIAPTSQGCSKGK